MSPKIGVVLAVVLVCAACTSSKQYLQRGEKLFQAAKYEDASLNFRRAIQKEPNLGEAYYWLALSELRLNNVRDGYQTMIHAVELRPDSQETKVSFADLCVRLYQADPRRPKALYDQAVETVGQLAAKEPKGYDTLRLKGYLALIDLKLQEGIADLRESNQAKPFQPETVLPLMQALIEDHRIAEAEKLGEELILKNKEYGAGYDLLYATYMSENNREQAQDVLKAKVANNPKRAEYALQLALHYLRLQERAPADAIVRNLVERSAEFPQVYLLAGDFYSRAGNWEEASRFFGEAAKRYPKDKLLYDKKLANVLIAEGKKEEAARMVNAILRDEPTDRESRGLRALLELDTEKPDEIENAVTELQALSEQAPEDVVGRFNLARAYKAKGDLEKARREFLQVLKQSPDLWPAHLLLAEIASQTEKPDEMLSQSAAVLAVQPGNAQARLLRAIALRATGNSVEADAELNRLIRDQPNFADAQLELGFFEVVEKKYTQAEEVFRKFYRRLQTRPRAVEGLVQVLTTRGKFDEALRLLQGEVKTSVHPAPLRILLAKTAIQAGKNDLAIEQLLETARENPSKSYQALLLLGETYSRRGSIDQAIATFEKARALAPNEVAPYVILASLEDRAGRKLEAIASYRSALKLEPENPALLNDLAFYLAENGGNLDEALSMAQLAVQKVSGQPDFSDTLGWIYFKKNMPDAALRVFNILVSKNPRSPVFRYHLAVALAAKGDKARARSALSDALTRNPSKQDEAKIRELLARLG